MLNSVSVMVGLAGDDSRPSVSRIDNPIPRGKSQSEFGDSEADTETVKSFSDMAQSSQASPMHSNEDLKKEQKSAHNRSASSLCVGEPAEKSLGWPLRRASSSGTHIPGTRNMSVVQWVMNLPDRSPQQSPQCSITKETPFEGGIKTSCSALDELPKELKSLLKTNRCRWFSHEVLKTSTSNFSSGL